MQKYRQRIKMAIKPYFAYANEKVKQRHRKRKKILFKRRYSLRSDKIRLFLKKQKYRTRRVCGDKKICPLVNCYLIDSMPIADFFWCRFYFERQR